MIDIRDKNHAEFLRKAGAAVVSITMLIHENEINRYPGEEEKPFLNGFTFGGLCNALELIGFQVCRAGEKIEEELEGAQ